MSRHIDAPVSMTTVLDPEWGEHRPAQFGWRRAKYVVVKVLDRWDEQGRWWEKELPLTVWRVEVRGGGVMELAMAHVQPSVWRLMRIWD